METYREFFSRMRKEGVSVKDIGVAWQSEKVK